MRPTRIPKPRQLNQELINQYVREGEELEEMFKTEGWKIYKRIADKNMEVVSNIDLIPDDGITFGICKRVRSIIKNTENEINETIKRAERYKEQKLYKKEEEIPIQTR